MAILSTLRRLRSRNNMNANPASSPPSDPPPLPPVSSSPSLPVPQASLRLRGEASKIGYAALEEATEPSRGEESGRKAEEEMAVSEQRSRTRTEGDAGATPTRSGLFRKSTKRWSSPPAAPAFSAIVRPRPDIPSPVHSDDPFAPTALDRREATPSPETPRRGTKVRRCTSSSSFSSATSPSLSPSSSFRTPLTSSTSLSSADGSTSSLSLNLGIQTRLDSSGRRVLTSRRRASDQQVASPTRCKRNKGAFGVGEEEENLWTVEEGRGPRVEKVEARMDDVFVRPVSLPEPFGIGLGLLAGGLELREDADASMETLHLPLDKQASVASSQSTPPASLRRSRPPLAPIQPFASDSLFCPPSTASSAAPPDSLLELRRRPPSIGKHQPIQPLYPPPPLYPPSPSRTSAFASLSRAKSAYSSSSSSSGGLTKRRHSLQPKKSLSRRLSVIGSGGAKGSASFGPPMTANLDSRRFSMPHMAPLTPLDRSDSMSASSFCPSPASSIFSSSIPPTPSTNSHATGEALLPRSLSPGGASFSASSHDHGDNYARLASSVSDQGHASAAAHARRASIVSFELPPEPPSSARRASQVENAYVRGRGALVRHRRAASDGQVLLHGIRRGEQRVEAGSVRLFIANPDEPTGPAYPAPSVPPVSPLPSPQIGIAR
ncbi:hypothetical protein JCM11641_006738 [Rhodosporidiobolus odoratus]